ncbi:Uncharacterised protein [Burkholderia pseudomallei]|nr:Uncharacterised protein [Burkholderia pseudomallei]CAJ7677904.1 Uncharacterised protein [Burkholderia pseudomallei]CAJ9190053.1 Uncharacterised protein [Burkholderia pseudomallei]CAJ9290078.1 Uncharacterised protein [Burkholderia pseudomallei]
MSCVKRLLLCRKRRGEASFFSAEKLLCIAEKCLCLAEGAVHDFQCRQLFTSIACLFGAPQEIDSDVDTIHCSRYLTGTIPTQRNECDKFVTRKAVDGIEHICPTEKGLRAYRTGLSCFDSFENSADADTSKTDPKCNSSSGQFGRGHFAESALTSICSRNVQSDDYRAACSDGRCDVPEVFLRANRAGDDGPCAKEGKESNSYQQPHKGKLSDFPGTLHDSPEFDFCGIVARRMEAA